MRTPYTIRILRLIADNGPMTSVELRAVFAQQQVEISPNTLSTTLKQLRKAKQLVWHSGTAVWNNPIRYAITEKGRAWLAKKEAK